MEQVEASIFLFLQRKTVKNVTTPEEKNVYDVIKKFLTRTEIGIGSVGSRCGH